MGCSSSQERESTAIVPAGTHLKDIKAHSFSQLRPLQPIGAAPQEALETFQVMESLHQITPPEEFRDIVRALTDASDNETEGNETDTSFNNAKSAQNQIEQMENLLVGMYHVLQQYSSFVNFSATVSTSMMAHGERKYNSKATICEAIIKGIRGLINCDRICIYLVDNSLNTFKLHQTWPEASETKVQPYRRMSTLGTDPEARGLVGLGCDGAYLNLFKPYQHAKFNVDVDILHGDTTKPNSMLITPVFVSLDGRNTMAKLLRRNTVQLLSFHRPTERKDLQVPVHAVDEGASVNELSTFGTVDSTSKGAESVVGVENIKQCEEAEVTATTQLSIEPGTETEQDGFGETNFEYHCKTRKAISAVIQLVNKDGGEGRFSSHDAYILKQIAGLTRALLFSQGVEKHDSTMMRLVTIMNKLQHMPLAQQLGTMANEAYDMMEVERISYFQAVPGTEELELIITKDENLTGFKIDANQGLVGTVFQSGKPSVLQNAQTDQRFDPSFDEVSGFTTRSLLAVPVIRGPETIGVLQALNKRDGIFTRYDIQSLSTLSLFIASLIEREEAEELKRKQREEREKLAEFIKTVSGDYDAEQVIEEMFEVIMALRKVDQIAFYIIDEQQKIMQLYHAECHLIGGYNKGALSPSISVISNGGEKTHSKSKPHRQMNNFSKLTINPSDPSNSFNNYDSLCTPTSPWASNSRDEKISFDNFSHSDTWTQIEEAKDKNLPLGGFAGQCVNERRPVIVSNAMSNSMYDVRYDIQPNYDSQNVLAVPVLDEHEKVIAVMQLVNKLDGDFTSDDERFITELCQHAGVVLSRVTTMEHLRHERRNNAALLRVLKVQEEGHDTVGDLLLNIIESTKEALDCDKVGLFFVDHLREQLFCVLNTDKQRFSIGLDQGVAGYVARTGEMSNIEDVYQNEFFSNQIDLETGYRSQSMLTFPIILANGSVIAVLQALNKKACANHSGTFCTKKKSGSKPRGPSFIPFNVGDIRMMRVLCGQIGIVLRRQYTSVMIERKDLALDDGDPESHPTITALLNRFGTSEISNSAGVINIEAESFGIPKWISGSVNAQELEHLRDLSFDCLKYDSDELLELALAMLIDVGVVEEFKLNRTHLNNFILEVRSRYRNVPFHNIHHGFCVMWFVYLAYTTSRIHCCFTKLEILSLLIAGLCHDVDHPGHTNDFEARRQSPLALLHNDSSVLENHHSYNVFEMLRQDNLNFFAGSNVDNDQFREFRNYVIKSILATDMSRHFTFCKQLDKFHCLENSGPNGKISKEHLPSPEFFLELICHAGDLSPQCLGLETALEWESRVTTEFMAQAEAEEALGLQVTPFMRGLEDRHVRAKAQLGFIDFVLMPLWHGMSDFLPTFKPCLQNLESNRKYYAQIQAGEKKFHCTRKEEFLRENPITRTHVGPKEALERITNENPEASPPTISAASTALISIRSDIPGAPYSPTGSSPFHSPHSSHSPPGSGHVHKPSGRRHVKRRSFSFIPSP